MITFKLTLAFWLIAAKAIHSSDDDDDNDDDGDFEEYDEWDDKWIFFVVVISEWQTFID